MDVTASRIEQCLRDVLNGVMSREAASAWAFAAMEANDRDDLVYIPAEREDQIWDAIRFLQGIDLKVSPDEYLHDREDIEEYLDEFTRQ